MIVHEGKPFDRTAHERFERARRLAHSIGVYDCHENYFGGYSIQMEDGDCDSMSLTIEELEERLVGMAEYQRTLARIATDALREWMAGR